MGSGWWTGGVQNQRNLRRIVGVEPPQVPSKIGPTGEFNPGFGCHTSTNLSAAAGRVRQIKSGQKRQSSGEWSDPGLAHYPGISKQSSAGYGCLAVVEVLLSVEHNTTKNRNECISLGRGCV